MQKLKSLRLLGYGIFGVVTRKWNYPNKYFIAKRTNKYADAKIKDDRFFSIYYDKKNGVLQLYPKKEYKPRVPIVCELRVD